MPLARACSTWMALEGQGIPCGGTILFAGDGSTTAQQSGACPRQAPGQVHGRQPGLELDSERAIRVRVVCDVSFRGCPRRRGPVCGNQRQGRRGPVCGNQRQGLDLIMQVTHTCMKEHQELQEPGGHLLC